MLSDLCSTSYVRGFKSWVMNRTSNSINWWRPLLNKFVCRYLKLESEMKLSKGILYYLQRNNARDACKTLWLQWISPKSFCCTMMQLGSFKGPHSWLLFVSANLSLMLTLPMYDSKSCQMCFTQYHGRQSVYCFLQLARVLRFLSQQIETSLNRWRTVTTG